MAVPTFVAAGAYLSETDGTSAVLAAPAGVQAGDILLAIVYKENTATITTVPTGFTQFGHEAATGQDHDTYVFWKRATSSEPATYTFSWTGSVWRTGFVQAFRGCIASGTPVDAYDGATSGSTSVTTTPAVSVTTTGADRLLVWFGGTYDVTSWTTPSGFTASAPAGAPSQRLTTAAYEVQASAGSSGTVQTTTTQSFTKTAHLVALIPESVAPVDPPGSLFDLTNWKWQGPIEDPNDPGDLIEVEQPELDTYSSDYLKLNASDQMVMTAPVDGFTTGDSARSEFREMEGGVEAAWSIFDSEPRSLTVTGYFDPTNVSGGSNPRPEMIIGQIHGPLGSPPVYLSAEYQVATPRIRLFKYNGSSSPGVDNMLSGITPTTLATYRLEYDPGADPASGTGRIKVYAAFGDETNLSSSPNFTFAPADFFDQTSDWYFKAGAYPKTRADSGATGDAVTTITRLELIQGSSSTIYTKTGGAAALGAGAGAKTLTPAATFDKAGGGAAVGAGSGAAELVPPAVHAKTGGAAAIGAGSGVRERTHDRTGGAAALGGGDGARQRLRSYTGGAAAIGAGAGTADVAHPATHERTGGAAAVGAGSGASEVQHAATHDRTGGAAAVGAGSGAKVIDTVTVHIKTGGAAALGAGSGARQRLRSFTGGAAGIGAGSGSKTVAPATVHEKSGGAAALGAGIGHATVGGAIEYSKTGGAATVGAGSGASEVQAPAIHDRTGGAGGVGAGSGARERTHDRTGGAAGVAAGSGAAVVTPAALHEKAGGAAGVGAGSGQLDLELVTVHEKSGGAAGCGAGSGAQVVTHASVYTKTGGAAGVGAGIALVEVIPPAVYLKTGGAAAVGAGIGRGRVGGPFHAGRPYRVGSWHTGEPVAAGRQHAGVPYAAGQHHAGPESVT